MASANWSAPSPMTEPHGSDLQGVKPRAVKDGDDYIINGSKIFITNGYLCDLVVVWSRPATAARRQGHVADRRRSGTAPAFSKGKPLKKVGMHAQDTCELFFKTCACRSPTCSGPRKAWVHHADAGAGLGSADHRHHLGVRPKPRSNTPWNTPATARSSARLWLRSITRASSWRR